MELVGFGEFTFFELLELFLNEFLFGVLIIFWVKLFADTEFFTGLFEI